MSRIQSLLDNARFIPLLSLVYREEHIHLLDHLIQKLSEHGIHLYRKYYWENNQLIIRFYVRKRHYRYSKRIIRSHLRHLIEKTGGKDSYIMRFKLLIYSSLRYKDLDPTLCMYSPDDVLWVIENHKVVQNWQKLITTSYVPHEASIYLMTPCTSVKPFNVSKIQRRLDKLLEEGSLKDQIKIFVISEPLGLVPKPWFWKMPIYDCPGLFRWYCQIQNIFFNESAYSNVIEKLGKIVGDFLISNRDRYQNILAYVKRNSTHHEILQEASLRSGIEINFFPDDALYDKLFSELGGFDSRYNLLTNKTSLNLLYERLIQMVPKVTHKIYSDPPMNHKN